MSYYSAIDRRINADEWFRNLDRDRQWLWFRLLTGQHVTAVAGLWPATEEGLARSFKMRVPEFRKLFRSFSGRAFADWDAGVLYLPNALRIEPNQPRNEATLKGWIKPLELVPECELRDRALRDFIAWIQTEPKRFPNGVPPGFPRPRSGRPMGPASGGSNGETVSATVTETVPVTVTPTVTATVSETMPSRARAQPRALPNQDQETETEQEQETVLADGHGRRFAMRLDWEPSPNLKASLAMDAVPGWAVEAILPRVRAHFSLDENDKRTDVEWNQAAAKWIRGDFRDPNKRPPEPCNGQNVVDEAEAARRRATQEARRKARAEEAKRTIGEPATAQQAPSGRDPRALARGIGGGS